MTGSNSSRKIPIHTSACPRESLVNDLSRLTYILCSCLVLDCLPRQSAGISFWSTRIPSVWRWRIDPPRIDQAVCAFSSFGHRKIRNTVHTSISIQKKWKGTTSNVCGRIIIIVSLMIIKQMPPSTHGAHELCYKHLLNSIKLLHGAFLSIGFPYNWHFHPYFSLKSLIFIWGMEIGGCISNFETLAGPIQIATILLTTMYRLSTSSELWYTYHPTPADQTTICLITAFNDFILYEQVRNTQLWYSDFACLLLSLSS